MGAGRRAGGQAVRERRPIGKEPVISSPSLRSRAGSARDLAGRARAPAKKVLATLGMTMRCQAGRPLFRPSTARPSSTSAASRPGRIPATVFPCSTQPAGTSARWGAGTPRTSGTPSRQPQPPGGVGPRAQPGPGALLPGREFAARAEEFGHRLAQLSGDAYGAEREVELAVRRTFTYAAWADKYDGMVHHTPFRNITLAMPEAIGVVGVICPDGWPLLGFLNRGAALAMGNTVVVVPSGRLPLAATDLYQVIDTSDIPGGVVNIAPASRRSPRCRCPRRRGRLWYGVPERVGGDRAARRGEHDADLGGLRPGARLGRPAARRGLSRAPVRRRSGVDVDHLAARGVEHVEVALEVEELPRPPASRTRWRRS